MLLGDLRGWKHLHVAEPLPRISLLSHFWTSLCMRMILKAAILVLQEYSDLFPSCYLGSWTSVFRFKFLFEGSIVYVISLVYRVFCFPFAAECGGSLYINLISILTCLHNTFAYNEWCVCVCALFFRWRCFSLIQDVNILGCVAKSFL